MSTNAGLRYLSAHFQATNSHIPATRWVANTPGSSVTYGSFTSSDQSSLDRCAFQISLLEASAIDPQQVFVLQVSYTVLHLGCRHPLRDTLMCSDTGVFVGVEPSELRLRTEKLDVFSVSNTALSITSGRLSYTLGLVGPCYSIDTACASSLAALHVSSAAVCSGECACGIQVGTKILSEAVSIATSIAGMTS